MEECLWQKGARHFERPQFCARAGPSETCGPYRLRRSSLPNRSMFNLSVSWWELVVRAVATYAFLLVLLRVSGKRQVGQLAPFDLVLLLVLSNAVQNSMNGGDNSLIGGLIS